MPEQPVSFVRYRTDVEVRQPDEDRVVEEIIAAMRGTAETGLDHYRHAVRPSHAKSHGLLKGELRVLGGLPEPLAQGLFAAPRAFPVAIRLATVPGDILADSVTTQRGMSIKVIGVEGAEMLPGHEGEVTQDFLLDNGSRFPAPDAATFLATIKGLEKTMNRLQPLKRAVSVASRGANAALKAVGLDSANLDFFGHPPVHPLADTYYSQAPLRYGDYMAKVAVAPVSENRIALRGAKFDPGEGSRRCATRSWLSSRKKARSTSCASSSAPTSRGCRSRTRRRSGRRMRARTGRSPGSRCRPRTPTARPAASISTTCSRSAPRTLWRRTGRWARSCGPG
jgi:hypothetical protein